MARDARQFWRALEQKLPGIDGTQEREIARSVLVLLRHRIRPEEAQHLKAELPEELRRLWAMPGIERAEERTARPITELNHNKFLERVQQLAHLPDVGHAARATAAVFGAVREVISEAEAEHVEAQLPSGLKELWRVGAEEDGRVHYERGSSAFWGWLDDRLEGQVAATAGEVACTVLAHLRARLSPVLAERIRAVLPSDLRSYWANAAPALEREELPERFVGRIAQDLDLAAEMDGARHAAAAALGALRRTLPSDLAEAVAAELPRELRGLWEGM